MQGLMYSINFSSTESAAQDLLSLGPVVTPDIAILHSVRIGQHTLAGDSNAEMVEIEIARASALGSGGGTPTPVPHMVGAPASGIVAHTSDTTEATGRTILLSDTFNMQAGWLYLPTPEERIVISSTAGDDCIAVTLPNSVTSAGFTGTLVYEHILG
jgi:hypothetical protein